MREKKVFIHLPGNKDAKVIPVSEQSTVKLVVEAIVRGGFFNPQCIEELNIFMDEDEAPLSVDQIRETIVHDRRSIIFHACNHVHVSVAYNGEVFCREFSPSTKLGKILDCALDSFRIHGVDASGIEIRLESRPEEDLSENCRISGLVTHGECELRLVLVHKPRVNG